MAEQDLIAAANAMADAARNVILPYFRTADLGTQNKESEGFDPVTEADKAAERAMRDVLAQCRPMDAIIGEEYGEQAGQSGLTWVLDPIDGTRGFMSGTPTWGVLIALADENGPIYGVIDQPYIGERFQGGLGRAASSGPHGETQLKTRDTRTLEDSILFSTFPNFPVPADQAGFDAVSQQVKLTRYGLDCYAYALLAAGQIDLVIETGLQSYDIQAPIAVIEAAGGIVTDWKGGPAHMGGRVVAAANSELHRAALGILSNY